MNFRTKQFLQMKFREYYTRCSLRLPPSFDRREWGFIMFDHLPEVRMLRHKAFGAEGEVAEYLGGMVPAHVFYSTAYYEYPAAHSMVDKGWQGADLIFDLDADHLRRKGEGFEEMLELVKRETIRLLELLVEDLGISTRDLEVVFSGSRGYHIHIYDTSVHSLESGARREIVDYLTVTGFDHRTVFKDVSTWSRRISTELLDFFCDLRFSMDRNEATKKLQSFDEIGEKISHRIMETLYRFDTPGEIEEYFRRRGSGFEQHRVLKLKPIAESIIESAGISLLRRETDEPVTTDVRRLIRLPSSLHGGSGLVATPVEMEKLEEFNPLTDALAFTSQPVNVICTKAFEITMREERFTAREGKCKLPEYAAIYGMCRGMCEYDQ
ncbi:DNA primase small subunit PriS [Candidatus Methanoperedenaceae archaeon GB50]|nr:DNA primase small subunit PriS [Candidatus Methanoperedenaceae archaeon GB50]